MKKKKSNIKDVAFKAGVSATTVSAYLNKSAPVNVKTAKRIEEAIKELGYIPNLIARSLSSGVSNNIGFIIPDITNPFFPEIVKGASEILSSKGFYLHLCNADNNPENEDSFIKDLESMWVGGIILAPSYSENRNLEVLNNTKVPLVIIDRDIKGIKKDMVVINNQKGAYEVTKYLIENNHKKIIFLGGPGYTMTAQNRFKGWKKAMQEANILDANLSFWGDFTIESGYKMIENILNTPNNIDAVFACNDLIAIGAMEAIDNKGLKIPDDISIIGFDGIYISKFTKPKLSTYQQPIYEIGKIAAELLINRIKKTKKPKTKKLVIDGNLIIRETVARKTKS